MTRKLGEYFEAGVRSVWYVYPTIQTIRVFLSATRYDDVSAPETIHGGEILSGFRLSLARLFADPPVSQSEPDSDSEQAG